MLLHYLKIAFRNISKEKFRYLLTTLGLAVGMVIFYCLFLLTGLIILGKKCRMKTDWWDFHFHHRCKWESIRYETSQR